MARDGPGILLQAEELLAAIEVTPDPEGCTCEELIISAYYRSQAGLIVLVLNGLTPQQVDRILDPVVPMLPLTIPGLRYCDVHDRDSLRDAVLRAREVRCQLSTLMQLEGWRPTPKPNSTDARELVGPEGFEPPTWPL